MFQACVLNIETLNPQDSSAFMNCFFKNRKSYKSVDDLVNYCGQEDDWLDVKECVASNSTELTEKNRILTEDAKLDVSDGLAIRINGAGNSDAEGNLFAEICKIVSLFIIN